MQNNCAISFVCHILDDFLITEPPAPAVPAESLSGIKMSLFLPAKTEEDSCKALPFMVIFLDSHKMEARLSGSTPSSVRVSTQAIDNPARASISHWSFKFCMQGDCLKTPTFATKNRPYQRCLNTLTAGF